MTRTLLLTLSGPGASKRMDAEIKRLEAAHLSAFQRKLDPSVLFVGSDGERFSPTLTLVACTRGDQRDLRAFLIASTATPSLQAA